MSKNKKDYTETLLKIFLSAIAIIVLKSIFENDSSKIISKKGRKMLSNEDKMSEFDKKVKDSEKPKKENFQNEIYL